MLRGTEKWVTYFVLGVIFIFGIVFLSKQIGLTMDLKQSLAQAKASGLVSGDLKQITHLHNASAKVFFLSFFAFCLLLIGIMIVMKGISRAYDISEVKEKVRHHLKSTTPGIVLIVLASFLLAFCTYRSAHIETVYSGRLLDYNNFKVAALRSDKPRSEPVMVDSAGLDKLKRTVDVPDIPQKVTGGISPAKQPVKSEQPKIVRRQKKEQVPQKVQSSAKIVKHEPQKTKEKQQTSNTVAQKTKNEHAIAKKSAVKKKKSTSEPVARRKTVEERRAVKEKEESVSVLDIAWAEQFQRKVTVFGYVPTTSEERRYDRVKRYLDKQGGGMINPDLDWAYTFLQKTKQGYEPQPGEMRRYEEIISRSLRSSSVPSQRSEL